jgi:hypothetical protein
MAHTTRVLVALSGLAAVAAFVACSSTSPAPAGDSDASTDGGAADVAPDHCLYVDDAGVTHGCGQGSMGPGDRDDGGDALAPPVDASPDASNLPFGAMCLDNAQCASGVCFDFKVRGQFCTKQCNSNADCPAPSPGCNGMGICRVGP